MIILQQTGSYALTETAQGTKMLRLGKTTIVWIESTSLGSILLSVRHPHQSRHTLSIGNYRLYEVTSEEQLTSGIHLELEVGQEAWQGYVLPHGLPEIDGQSRKRITSTSEIITHHLAYQPLHRNSAPLHSNKESA